jgi:dienelactone hydrolase
VRLSIFLVGFCALAACKGSGAAAVDATPVKITGEVVTFSSGDLELRGVLYRPQGPGPFPAIVYNHGSAPGMMSISAAEALGPVFAARGWVFFMPSRRGQGLSADAGPYIEDEIGAARRSGGPRAAASAMVRLLSSDHLSDQLAALAWLKKADFVRSDRIAVAGNSFGGIETVLGAERGSYCAAVDSAGAAQSWARAPELQDLLIRSARSANAPVFFFQADNDYDLTPSRTLFAEMKKAGKEAEIKIYPAFGNSTAAGHAFGYFGSPIWGPDVFAFLEKHCAGAKALDASAPAQDAGSGQEKTDKAMIPIQEYATGLSRVHATNPDVKLSLGRDPSLADETVLSVEYPAPTADPAGRDVWCDAEQRDWSAGRAIAFRVKPDHAVRLSVSFFDRNRVAYTAWVDLRGGVWQPVRLPFDEYRPNPYFQRPDAKTGAPLDVREVTGVAFAPQDETPGRLAIGKFVVSP